MAKNESIVLPTTILSIRNFLLHSIIFFLPIYFSKIGLSGFQIGILLSAFTVTALISSSIAGLLSDRHPIKYLSAFSFLLLIIFVLGLSATKDFRLLLVFFVIGGIGSNISEIFLSSFVLKTIEKKKAGKKLGFFNSTTNIASGLGALVGGLVIAKIDFENIFLLIPLLFLVVIFLSLFIKKIETFRSSIEHYKGDLFKKEIILFIIIIFIFTLHWGAEMTSYALLLKNNMSLSPASIGLYIGTIWILYGIFIFLAGKFTSKDKFLSKTIYIGLFASGLGHILFVCPDLFYSYLFRMVHEFGDAIVFLFIFLAIHRHFPTSRIGGTSGVILTVTVIGKFAGSLIFGHVGDAYGYHLPFIISGILTLLCIPILTLYMNLVNLKSALKFKVPKVS